MDALTLGELENLTRVRLDDFGKTKPRWVQSTIFDALNEAQREASFRGRLLRDNIFDATTKITVVANTTTYNLHPSVFEVNEVRLDSDGKFLEPVTLDELNAVDRQWRTRTGNLHSYLIRVLPSEQMRLELVSMPIAADTIRLDVYRMPIDLMADADSDTPEIAPRHHHGLIDWALYRCYLVPDPDLFNPVKASDHYAAFEARFGIREEANVERKHRERSSMAMTPRAF